MDQPATSLTLIGLTLVSAVASVLAFYRLRWSARARAGSGGESAGDSPANAAVVNAAAGRVHLLLVGVVMVGSAGVLGWRWWRAGASWEPVHAHVDGLVLIAALLAGVILFLLLRPGWFGISAFASPLLTLILAWAICASAWTYRPFELRTITPVWSGLHLVGVYLGTLFAAIGAVAGGMYLYVRHRLKHKAALPTVGRPVSLESLETAVIRSATGGFVLLTIGLVAGFVIVGEHPRTLGPGWWHGPKVILAAVVWTVYALLINVRFASTFRGPRAAWLAILGLVLLLVSYGVITGMGSGGSDGATKRQSEEGGGAEKSHVNKQTVHVVRSAQTHRSRFESYRRLEPTETLSRFPTASLRRFVAPSLLASPSSLRRKEARPCVC